MVFGKISFQRCNLLTAEWICWEENQDRLSLFCDIIRQLPRIYNLLDGRTDLGSSQDMLEDVFDPNLRGLQGFKNAVGKLSAWVPTNNAIPNFFAQSLGETIGEPNLGGNVRDVINTPDGEVSAGGAALLEGIISNQIAIGEQAITDGTCGVNRLMISEESTQTQCDDERRRQRQRRLQLTNVLTKYQVGLRNTVLYP